MSLIPKSHPRAKSLFIREKLVKGFDNGLVAKEGLLAQGRGEAFDYLLGEKTGKSAKKAMVYYKKALKSRGYNVLIYERLGRYFFDHGDYAKAIEFFSKRLKLTEKRIFQPDLYEEEDHMMLFKTYLKEHQMYSYKLKPM